MNDLNDRAGSLGARLDRWFWRIWLAGLMVAGVAWMWASSARAAQPDPAVVSAATANAARDALVQQYGEGERARIERGVTQVRQAWRAEDGSAADFARFVHDAFVPTGAPLDGFVQRYREALEAVEGHVLEIGRELRRHVDLDLGPVTPVDEAWSSLAPGAHLQDDYFKTKIALMALANLPLTTLPERLRGTSWTRKQWAEARIDDRFSERVPADIEQRRSIAGNAAALYIAQYNLYMHHLLVDGARPFPRGLKLLSHWNLRDEIKAHYADDGLARQRVIARVMERIVDQSIPAVVVDNPAVDWEPFANTVSAPPAAEIEPRENDKTDIQSANTKAISNTREPDTRYQRLLDIFHAQRAADPYFPRQPTLIVKRFEVDREIPEVRFVQAMRDVLKSPLVPKVAALIRQKLGRPLEPFDVWYDGFRPRAKYSEAQLDAIVKKRYPTAAAYHADMPRLLQQLGFSPARARYFAAHIVVDPARGSGHALESMRRGDDPHLRTRIEKGGMDYKGYNIAVHEMGHNVEQICSLYFVDDWLLRGVPNTAFTEALAFVFQARDLELLGLAKPDATTERGRRLSDFWATYEIAGVALVDLTVWHWLYDHPWGNAADLRQATVQIARDTWNEFYAPVFGVRDSLLLGVYSHMIDSSLYLPDYPLGHLIAAQIEEHLSRHKPLGAEFERMASFGNVTPDLWMKHATGEEVSARALLQLTEAALGKADDAAPHPVSPARGGAK